MITWFSTFKGVIIVSFSRPNKKSSGSLATMVNPLNVLRLLQKKYRSEDHSESPITFEEEDLAAKLFEVIENCMNSSLSIESDVDLDFNDNW